MGFIPWSPLAGGALAGALEKAAQGRRADEQTKGFIEKNRGRLEAFENLCKKIGEPPSVVGLAWLLRNPAVTAPIIGPRSIEQLESAMHATEITLDAETLATLEEIFPGPGGEAPKAYAW
jgi:aryl-alcohol dehydrogenase-like predicted oxidoreductase